MTFDLVSQLNGVGCWIWELQKEYQKSLRRQRDKISRSFFCQEERCSFFLPSLSLQQSLLYSIYETERFTSSRCILESLMALLRIWRSRSLPLDLMRLPVILLRGWSDLGQPFDRAGKRLVRSQSCSQRLLDITESSLRLRKSILRRVRVCLSLGDYLKGVQRRGESKETFLFQRKQPCYLMMGVAMLSYLISFALRCSVSLRLTITTACPYFLNLMACSVFQRQVAFSGVGVGWESILVLARFLKSVQELILVGSSLFWVRVFYLVLRLRCWIYCSKSSCYLQKVKSPFYYWSKFINSYNYKKSFLGLWVVLVGWCLVEQIMESGDAFAQEIDGEDGITERGEKEDGSEDYEGDDCCQVGVG